MMPELKPCPFCYCGNIYQPMEETIRGSSWKPGIPICTNCGATFDGRLGLHPSVLWNCRAPGWISVKGRLPETTGRYQVVFRHFSQVFHVGLCDFNSEKKTWACYSDHKVSHWMPIPELPEGGK